MHKTSQCRISRGPADGADGTMHHLRKTLGPMWTWHRLTEERNTRKIEYKKADEELPFAGSSGEFVLYQEMPE